MRMLGKTKWFDRVKNFGFIRPDDGDDLYVHISDIADGLLRQKVQHALRQAHRGAEPTARARLPHRRQIRHCRLRDGRKHNRQHLDWLIHVESPFILRICIAAPRYGLRGSFGSLSLGSLGEAADTPIRLPIIPPYLMAAADSVRPGVRESAADS